VTTTPTDLAPAAPTASGGTGVARGRRSSAVFEVGLAGTALVLPIVVALVSAWNKAWVPSSDDALIELRALDVPSHLPLVGVYSRYKFHHPGPVLFLVDAGPVHLFGPKGLFVASALVNGVAVVLTAWLLRRRGGTALLMLGTLVLLVLMHALADQLLDPWNPWITTLPFVLFIVSVWSVSCRDWRALPIAAATGSFVVQAHLAFGLLVAVLLGGSLVWAAYALVQHRRGRARTATEVEAGERAAPSWVLLGVTVVVLVGFWFLPLVDQVRNDPGNLALIAQSIQDPSEPPAGLGQAIDVAVHSWGTSVPWITAQEAVEPFSGRVSGAPLWTLLPMLALVVAAAALGLRRRARAATEVRDAGRGVAVVLAGCAIGFVSIVRITGNALPYLVRWTWGLGALLTLTSVWLIITAALSARPDATDAAAGSGNARDAGEAGAETDGARTATSRRTPSGSRGVGLLVGAVLVVAASLATAVAGASAALPDEGHGEVALGVIDPAMAQLRAAGPLLVRREGTDYGEIMQGVYAELERRGLPVYLLPDDAFLVGDHRVLHDGSPHATLYVVTTDGVAGRLATGEAPLASHDRLSPAERQEYDALQRRGQQQYLELVKGVPPTDPLTAEQRARLDALTPRADRALLYLVPAP